MRIALYSRTFSQELTPYFNSLFAMLAQREVDVLLWAPTKAAMIEHGVALNEYETFQAAAELNDVDLLISIGGDGTLLDTVEMTAEKSIPVLGVNTGRMGFLSNTQVEEAEEALLAFLNGELDLEERSMLCLEEPEQLLTTMPIALNEIAVHKRDTSSMIIIHAYLDGEFLNSYWADGLIISTPTGSTAYSLSCGGPIIDPRSNSFVITPIAPHNLNVRPFVVRDNGELTLQVDGREGSFMLSLDSRSVDVDQNVALKIKRNSTNMKLINFKGHDFLNTLRQKLSWGLDRRN